jgi:hypothetical protein
MAGAQPVRKGRRLRTPRRSTLLYTRILMAAACLGAWAQAHVDLSFPMGGEKLVGGSEFTIGWEADDHNCVYNLYFSGDSGENWSVIRLGLPQETRSFKWTVPETDTESAMVRILQDNAAGTDLDSKSPIFSITAPAGLPQSGRRSGNQAVRLAFALRSSTLQVTLGLAKAEDVSVLAFDAGGRKVATLLRERREAGSHRITVPLDGLSGAASPFLFFQARAGGEVRVIRASVP